MVSFSVVTNIASVNAQANLEGTSAGLRQALTRVSSGLRINSSADDAAGLAIANQFRSGIAILNQGIRNANDGLSTLQIKDGALNNISTLVDRLATLATQSASGNTTDGTRTILNQEFQDVLTEITRESAVANLSVAAGFSVFVSNNGANGVISGNVGAVTNTSLTLAGHVLTSQALAQSAVEAITSAITAIGVVQGNVGSIANRLTFAISLARSQVVNNRAAESRIRDANIAEESANLTRFSIPNQSGIAALAQANSSSGSVLALLR